jgi:hypothetical protein
VADRVDVLTVYTGEEATLAREPAILDALDADLRRDGLVADRLPAARLIYLALVSRLFARPVSVVVKGPSSAGKSWLVDRVLSFCPPEAYHRLTSMSEKALVYDDTPLVHRHLIVGEAVAIAGTTTGSLLRELLSAGCIRHATVESTPDGLRPKIIERPGPTGLISTTTEIALHAETETRLLSVTIGDSQAAQRAVHATWGAKAAGLLDDETDRRRWHQLGSWLATGERRVVLPFGQRLGEAMPATAIRLQRDLITLITLVQAHALLHRASRERDDQGRIVAELGDYAVVRELVEPIVASGVGATVRSGVRRVVQAVGDLSVSVSGVSQTDLVNLLSLDKAAISRLVREAIAAGWLVNDEDRAGQPARLRIGDPLPDDDAVLPKVSDLARRGFHPRVRDQHDNTGVRGRSNDDAPSHRPQPQAQVEPGSTRSPS